MHSRRYAAGCFPTDNASSNINSSIDILTVSRVGFLRSCGFGLDLRRNHPIDRLSRFSRADADFCMVGPPWFWQILSVFRTTDFFGQEIIGLDSQQIVELLKAHSNTACFSYGISSYLPGLTISIGDLHETDWTSFVTTVFPHATIQAVPYDCPIPSRPDTCDLKTYEMICWIRRKNVIDHTRPGIHYSSFHVNPISEEEQTQFLEFCRLTDNTVCEPVFSQTSNTSTSNDL